VRETAANHAGFLEFHSKIALASLAYSPSDAKNLAVRFGNLLCQIKFMVRTMRTLFILM